MRLLQTFVVVACVVTSTSAQVPATPERLAADTRAALAVGARNATAARARAEEFAAGAKSSATAPVLVAQGDSWFAYPFYNVLRYLEWEHGYRIESTAHNGEWLETMAYDREQLTDLALLFRKLRDHGTKPRAILLSGGGNDIAGQQLTVLLNHRDSGLSPLDATVVEEMIAVRLRRDMTALIGAVKGLSSDYFGDSNIPIFIHGYSRPVPDGRGYLGGWGPLPGPWLRPAFDSKGYDYDDPLRQDEKAATLAIAALIDRYNTVLDEISHQPGITNVHLVRTLDLLTNDLRKYKEDWGNEMHPTQAGFKKVANRFAEEIGRLPANAK